IRWSRDGDACPPIEVAVENCASMFGLARLQLRVPPELSTRCPGLQVIVTELPSVLTAEHPVGHGPSLPAAARLPFIAIVAVVLMAGLLIRYLLTATTGTAFGCGGVGWFAFTVAAAIPFFVNTTFAITAELGGAWIVFIVLLFDSELLGAESRAQK